MNRKEFKSSLDHKVNGMSRERITRYKSFMQINEMSDDFLTEEQKTLKYSERESYTGDKELNEGYQMFHLSKTISTKWARMDLDKIVGYYYKDSEEIKKMYGK